MKYRAEFRRNGRIIRTRFYDDRITAQDMLAKRIGPFVSLGCVAGDANEPGKPCTDAPRNGGLVSIESR